MKKLLFFALAISVPPIATSPFNNFRKFFSSSPGTDTLISLTLGAVGYGLYFDEYYKRSKDKATIKQLQKDHLQLEQEFNACKQQVATLRDGIVKSLTLRIPTKD